jgi:hypothetical protein
MCFVCELPAKEIALTHVEVDSQISPTPRSEHR